MTMSVIKLTEYILDTALQLINTVQSWEYLVLNVLGVLVMMAFGGYAARKSAFGWIKTLFYVAGIPVAFLIGIRLGYLFFYADINNPAIHFLDLKLYGFSLYLGLILVVAYSLTAAWLNRVSVWSWLDFHTPGLLGYVALGKIGCYINGCCFGIPTLVPWGINYTPGSQAYNYYIVQAFGHTASHSWSVYSDLIHPVQLYEVTIAIALLITAYILLRKKVLPGTVFLISSAIYSLARLGLLFLRANPETGTYFYLLPWLYVTVTGLSLVILLQRYMSNINING
jgi:phosphatidylglycerol:prolipoprotein diacylglycerol transferase